MAVEIEVDAVHAAGFGGQAVLIEEEGGRLDGKAGLLQNLAVQGVLDGLAVVDLAARQAPCPRAVIRICAAQHQNPPGRVGDDGPHDGDGEEGGGIGHGFIRGGFPQLQCMVILRCRIRGSVLANSEYFRLFVFPDSFPAWNAKR